MSRVRAMMYIIIILLLFTIWWNNQAEESSNNLSYTDRLNSRQATLQFDLPLNWDNWWVNSIENKRQWNLGTGLPYKKQISKPPQVVQKLVLPPKNTQMEEAQNRFAFDLLGIISKGKIWGIWTKERESGATFLWKFGQNCPVDNKTHWNFEEKKGNRMVFRSAKTGKVVEREME